MRNIYNCKYYEKNKWTVLIKTVSGLTQNQRIWSIFRESVRLETAPTAEVRKSYV